MPEDWERLLEAVRAWSDKRMEGYLELVRAAPRSSRTTIVNDTIWGSIRLTPIERAFIDSPILQRMRRIRQLGPAHLVYPSAQHTRFEHSIGALHRAGTVLDVIIAASESRPDGSPLADPVILDKWSQALRLGALLHDVGHVFMSHVGERSITHTGFPEFPGRLQPMLERFSDAEAMDCEADVHLSDFLSFAILTAKSTTELATLFALSTPQGLDVGQCLSVIAGAVIHSRKLVAPRDRWISDVLSGPLDVDKQDYVPRDARIAGVGVQLEPHRCAEVIRVCDVRNARVANGKSAFEDGERRVVMTFAGATVIEDMLLSRMLLQLRVYYHQAVRVAERTVEELYRHAVESGFLSLLTGDASVSGVLDLCDSTLLDGHARQRVEQALSDRNRRVKVLADQETSPEGLSAAGLEERQKIVPQIEALRLFLGYLSRLELRRLPIRAYAYGSAFPKADRPEIGAHFESALPPWAAVFKAMQDPTTRRQVEADIVEATIRIASEAGAPLSDTDRLILKTSVFADIAPSKAIELSAVYVLPHPGESILVAYDKLFQPGQWLDALRDSKHICYVFAPRRLAHFVHMAAEAVFSQRFRARANQLRLAYSRCDHQKLRELKEGLVKKFGNDLVYRDREPVPGLWSSLTPPSFVSAKAARDVTYVLDELDRQKRELYEANPELVSAVYDLAKKSDSVRLGVIVDLIGSSAYWPKVIVGGKAVGEAEVRSFLLKLLQEYIVRQCNLRQAGLLPLKLEGDAVVAIAYFPKDESLLREFRKRLQAAVLGGEWNTLLTKELKAVGWTLEGAPAIRALVSEGDIGWEVELDDILGEGVTAMFKLEDPIKKEAPGGPSIAWLGNRWGPLFEMGDGHVKEHAKLTRPVKFWIEQAGPS